MNELRTRKYYIDNLQSGSLVAYSNERGMFTGKILAVFEDSVNIQTLNKSIYTIPKKSISWVKIGSNWPIGIRNALEESKRSFTGKQVK